MSVVTPELFEIRQRYPKISLIKVDYTGHGELMRFDRYAFLGADKQRIHVDGSVIDKLEKVLKVTVDVSCFLLSDNKVKGSISICLDDMQVVITNSR